MPRIHRIEGRRTTNPDRRNVRLRLGVLCAMCGLFIAPAGADTSGWDCRSTPDGRAWQCSQQDGAALETIPVERPPAAATIKAAREPAPLPGTATPPTRVTPPEPVPPAPTTRPEPPAQPPQPPAQPHAAPSEPTLPAAATEPAPAPVVSTIPEAPAPTVPPAAEPVAPAFNDASGLPDLTQTPRSTGAATPTEVVADGTSPTPIAGAPEPSETASAPRILSERQSTIDDGIDWGSCRIQTSQERAATNDAMRGGSDQPIEITADDAVAELDPQRGLFSGDVRVVQGETLLRAERVTLDRASGELHAEGDLLLSRPDIRFAGSSADYRISTREAEVANASYRVPAIRARGDAARAAFLGNGVSRFDDITYTTCAPGDASWLLSANELELDQNAGFGTAKGATLRFKGVPLLYAPRLTFPIDDQRRSGVLVPSVGYGDNNGADVSVPYYFNLAENYDLTLTPRLMSKRGLMLGGEFRYLTHSSYGTLAADILPDDRKYDGDDSLRGSASLINSTRFNARSTATLRLNYVTDSDYFQDLGGNLAATSATHLERAGELSYHGDHWDLTGRMQYYQTIDDAIAPVDRPYSRMPQVRLKLNQPDGIGGLTYHVDAEYAYFRRDDSVHGHRVDLLPALSLPLGESWWFVEPKIGARYTAYELNDQTAGLDDSPSHATGLLSLDSGMLFDRAISYFGNSATQTLEPRLYYLFLPAGSQDEQPLFDTGLRDFTFDNLFRENRFNGPDRVADANQVTLALTSRINAEDSGEELLRASIGQILYFDDRDVNLPGEADEDESTSAVVGELAARLGGGWRTRAGLQWDPHDGDNGTIDEALAQISYRDRQRHVFNAAYRLRDGVANQTDLALLWPLNERFTLIGRHNYSLRDDRLLEALAGIEYGTCCWRIRAVARRYTDSDGDDHNMAFMLQLVLNGLGRLGDDIDSTLERGIYGYRNEDDD